MRPPALPPGVEPDPAQIAEAIAMITGGLARVEIELAASVSAPLFWVMRGCRGHSLRNGTAFFLNTGQRLIGVTAAHVVRQFFDDSRLPSFVQCMIAGGGPSMGIFLGDRLIDASTDLDIATFHITADEVARLGRTVLTGYQKQWPPQLAEVDGGITYCGFPGRGRRFTAEREIGFGVVTAAGIATSVSEISISVQIERANLVSVIGQGVPPENFDFGGISGGPIIAIVQTPDFRSWIPAGVIIQGPNPGGDGSESIADFEVIKARPIQYILPDGHLDLSRWGMNNLHRAG